MQTGWQLESLRLPCSLYKTQKYRLWFTDSKQPVDRSLRGVVSSLFRTASAVSC